MIIGVNLPNYGPLGTREAMTTIAGHAEELGFASLWTSDHVLLPAGDPGPYGHLLETFTSLTWLAAHTHRIRLATGILVLPQRDPLLVAKQAATLHHLAGGRLTLGVAAGWAEREFELLGADFHHRGAIEEEYITALRVLFEQSAPVYRGEHVRFADVVFSPRPATPLPIVVGGNSPAALRRARAFGDGWYGLRLSPDQVRDAIAVLGRPARTPFATAVRVRISDADNDLSARVAQFSAAGADELVVEPVTDDLKDFLVLLDQVQSTGGLG